LIHLNEGDRGVRTISLGHPARIEGVVMFKHILVAVDDSERAAQALSLALRIAGDAKVSVIKVVPDYGTAEFVPAVLLNHPDVHELRQSLAALGRSALETLLAAHRKAGKHAHPIVAVSDDAAGEIVEAAAREHCDLIVMGSHGRGRVASALLGSQVQRVLAMSKVPVLVACHG
jgi:nucleotide-binding universal stress UspA family protein